ncbi:hypothetical protein MRX96_008419 [Rhipicephalus microplus]
MSDIGTNPYSTQYPVVVQPPYRSVRSYSTGAYDTMGPYGFMGPYGPMLPYGPMAPYSRSRQQGYDSRTQNLLFYICAVSFMCAFVVLMVYSAIAMRRHLYNLTTEDGGNSSSSASSSARKTDVTGSSTPAPFDWRQPNDDRTGDRDGVRNDIVPDQYPVAAVIQRHLSHDQMAHTSQFTFMSWNCKLQSDDEQGQESICFRGHCSPKDDGRVVQTVEPFIRQVAACDFDYS